MSSLPVPSIEITHHADTVGIRRPHRESDTGDARAFAHVRTHLFVGAIVLLFREQVQVEFAERRQVRIWGANRGDTSAGEMYFEAIGKNFTLVREQNFEQSGLRPRTHRQARPALDDQDHALRARPVGTDDHSARSYMRAEYGMRIVMAQREETAQVFPGNL